MQLDGNPIFPKIKVRPCRAGRLPHADDAIIIDTNQNGSADPGPRRSPRLAAADQSNTSMYACSLKELYGLATFLAAQSEIVHENGSAIDSEIPAEFSAYVTRLCVGYERARPVLFRHQRKKSNRY